MKKSPKTTLIDFYTKFNETKNIVNKQKILSRFFTKNIFYQKIFLAVKIAVLLMLLILACASLLAIYQKIYQASFFPGIMVANNKLNGLSYQTARQEILKKTDNFSREGLNVVYGNKKINITAATLTDTPDTSFDLFNFDITSTLNKTFSLGKKNNLLDNLKTQVKLFLLKPNIPIEYYLDDNKLEQILKENFEEFAQTAVNATITINNNNELSIKPEEYGTKFNYQKIINDIKNQIAYLHKQDIIIQLQTDVPQAYARDMEPIIEQAKIILSKAPYELIASDSSLKNPGKKFLIEKNNLASLLGANPDPDNKNYFLTGLKRDETEHYLTTNVMTDINLDPIDAKFQIENNRVVEFTSSQNGQKLNIDQTIKNFEKIIQTVTENTTTTASIMLAIDELTSDITNDTTNNLGIKDLLGTGHSNFVGSPANRRHNISVGATAVNGTLIKPGEEFSLLKTLGKIDGSTGYLPELVIKDNATVPEYGGGLCQIGTTVFRGSTEAGLLITSRQNHSYRVSYYEPAGTDATIYDPVPDFKFINNTKNYILIQSRIDKNDLYFDFWGTKDGRKITKTEPVIYNITRPPSTKLLETETLAPGVKKCTERAHNGADAYFDYTVEYADGQKNEVRFKSHYRPWQEVCLIGIEKKATSTLEIISQN